LARRTDVVFFDAGGVLVGFPPLQRRVASALEAIGEMRPPEVIVAAAAAARARRDRDGPIDLAWPQAVEDAAVTAAADCLAAGLGLPPELGGYLRDACYHIRTLRLLPGAAEALDALWAAGIATGLISNAPGSLRAALHGLGVLGRLRPALISAELGCCKPDRRIYELALLRAGVTAPDRALFVDDLAPNVAGARAAGLRALRLDPAGGGDLEALPGLFAHLD